MLTPYTYKYGNKLIVSLRVGRSLLNAHAFSIGLADSPECNCGAKLENSFHLLITCPLYCNERRVLFGLVEQYLPKFNKLSRNTMIDILLFGYKPSHDDFFLINCRITCAVQNFLIKIKRFET